MQKPPEAMEVKWWKKSFDTIALHSAIQIKPSQQQRSRIAQQPNESLKTYPPLPEHLDRLIDQPWNNEASLLIDLWLWCVEQEFEIVEG